MTHLTLTKKNLTNFINAYSAKMESKKQSTPTPSILSRASSRSRSKSKPRARFSKGKNAKKKASASHGKLLKAAALKTLKPFIDAKSVSDKGLALAKSGYFSNSKDSKVDVPSLQKENDQLIKEIQLAVGAIKAGLKDKPIKMRLSAIFVITTTVTTGVTNTLTIGGSNSALNPSYCTEWTTITALFDEYKMLGGQTDFIYGNINAAPESGAPNWTSDCVPIMAYDCDDQTAPTSSILLTQSSQHKTFNPGQKILGAAGAIVGGGQGETHHKFHFHIPRGDVDPVTNGGILVAPGTQWQSCGTPLTHGFLKFYHLGSVVTAKDTGAGFVYFDLEFRCRV